MSFYFYGVPINDTTQHTQFEACRYKTYDHPYFHKCYDCDYACANTICGIYQTYLLQLDLAEGGLKALANHLEEMERLRNEGAEGPYEEYSESFMKHAARFY